MTLDSKDILQIDATIIAGLLIFFTIINIVLIPELGKSGNRTLIISVTINMITPFIISALGAILADGHRLLFALAKWAMFGGFILLFLGLLNLYLLAAGRAWIHIN
jgi:hypothetical protein